MTQAFERGYMAGWNDAVQRLKEQISGMDLKPRPGAEPPAPPTEESPTLNTCVHLSAGLSGGGIEVIETAYCVRCQREHRRPVAIAVGDFCWNHPSPHLEDPYGGQGR